ncbi:putative type VI secretion system effector [Burkholderia anthina]|uniref:putative type VI secretion system effector n=1 Tax=Burkholderia anthina TaxID=179879 RepID=UPI001AA02DF0|nr:putative type VI secretion system effector [Burkholderia anthina]QTD93121.1 hypothetical protein J4G50_19765 [Burkholderia anthina]
MNPSATETSPTHLLKGHIQNLRKTRRNQDFFFTAAARAKRGATAITAGLAGLGGIATGLSGMALDTTEEADLLEFEIYGQAVRVWVCQSVFNEGDDVEVVAEKVGEVWQGYGIFGQSDKIVALHPHCSRGRWAHYKASLKLVSIAYLTLVSGMAVVVLVVGLFHERAEVLSMVPIFAVAELLIAIVLGVVGFRISRKFMGFVRLAERVFETFGWREVKNIDLPAITKKDKAPNDPVALGVSLSRRLGKTGVMKKE